MTATRVELRIRRLVLDSADGVSRAALCAAVETELAVLLGLSPAGGPRAGHGPTGAALAYLSAHVSAHVSVLGRHIARAVHRAMCEAEGEGVS
ncbi:hypothetical protein [Streptomyces sp. 3214.6]|uniref:hypothetical protein n=1 Tax=Streptomyces sp. 3214.6 TaxID=1882757 RepID=UPI00090C6C55|nr:hypothetical protein [Streptomyces sp. 3214.6]SHI50495.1 hypothetical protein SAMN05444521_7730 [Streptomyces sp. 3214.6]